jgi:anti-sigma B factor antagonist/stage II sporulation protein AA (anti-sigma F factor antagonist)
MEIDEQRIGNALVLAVTGRLDHSTARHFDVAIEPHMKECAVGGTVVVLDLSRLEFMSSTGMRSLLIAQIKARNQKGSFAVAAPRKGVKETFEIANFSKVIRCYDSVPAALAELAPAAADAFPQQP